MATVLKSSPVRRARRALGSLFEEARRLERRRRFRCAAGTLLIVGIIAGGAFLFIRRGHGNSADGPKGSLPLLSSKTLPRNGDYFDLAAVNNRLVLSGGPTGSLFPSQSTTTLSGDRATGTCDVASVNTSTLKLGRVIHANCGDPALYGEQVLAISYLIDSPSRVRGVGIYTIRIAHANPHALDGYTLGPVVGTYTQCSDCSAEWVYGDHSLWIYGVYAGGHSELLRISDATGKVAQRWKLSTGVDELLAADDHGLWFAPSIESGTPLHATKAQRTAAESLYHLTPGAHEPTRELVVDTADWLTVSGDTAWVESRSSDRGRMAATLWRVSAATGKATAVGSYSDPLAQGVDISANRTTHVGSAALGIYYVNVPGSTSLKNSTAEIMRLDPAAARQDPVAAITAPDSTNEYEGFPAAALGQSIYFLAPQTLDYRAGRKRPIVQGQATLYRLTPR